VKNVLRYSLTATALLATSQGQALEAISDREMANVSGQAFITIDASSYNQGTGEWSGDYEFTKVNLGLDIETLLTIDELRVGEFDRNVGDAGTVAATDSAGNPVYENGVLQAYDADLIIENFGLGRVTDYLDAVNADFDEFRIRDPYLELAYKTTNGVREIAGVRIGFAESQGWLSGDLISLTGNLNGYIEGPVSIVYEQNCPGAGFIECTELWAANLLGTQLVSSIDLVDGAVGTTGYSYGAGAEYNADGELTNPDNPYLNVPYLKRASWAGVPAGRNFTAPGSALEGLIPALTGSEDCQVTGTPACFQLTKFQSVYIGDESIDFESGGGATGVFVSLQTQSVPWEDLSGIAGADRVLTQRGAYLNIAAFESNGQTKYPLVLDLYSATNGSAREATCVGQLKGC